MIDITAVTYLLNHSQPSFFEQTALPPQFSEGLHYQLLSEIQYHLAMSWLDLPTHLRITSADIYYKNITKRNQVSMHMLWLGKTGVLLIV